MSDRSSHCIMTQCTPRCTLRVLDSGRESKRLVSPQNLHHLQSMRYAGLRLCWIKVLQKMNVAEFLEFSLMLIIMYIGTERIVTTLSGSQIQSVCFRITLSHPDSTLPAYCRVFACRRKASIASPSFSTTGIRETAKFKPRQS